MMAHSLKTRQKTILLTFDVEDWFQVENFKEYIPFSSWDSKELRIEKNVHLILDLLDSLKLKPKATFFVLGWIAKKSPILIREIVQRGHEIASHGRNHHLCTALSSKALEQDLKYGKNLLEDITGEPVYGYRAPSFAVNDDILEIIKKTGHLYDSSYNSFAMHGRYGKISLASNQVGISCFEIDKAFYEIPISNLHWGRSAIPLGGGGYFRLFPLILFLQGMKQVFKKEKTFTFYSHPWEFDPDQPKVHQASRSFKFRHYVNQASAAKKLKKMIEYFDDCYFISCENYIKTFII